MKSLWGLLVLLFLTVGRSEGGNEVRHLREEDQTPGTTTEIQQRRFFRVKREPCGGVFRAAKGTITSPGYPAKYPPNKSCIYDIVAPSGKFISLKFTHFNLESHSNCGFDSVKISCTTRRGTVDQYGRACGSTPPASIYCEGSKLNLEFKSDGSNEYSGFVAEYNMSLCGGDLDSSSGVITSPNYPRDYSANTNCTWSIIGSPTERIVVEFKQFNLEYSSANCGYDHVLAYTERGSEINLRYGPFCGTTVPGRVVSEENTLFLNFKTDHSEQRSGFSANYWKEPCGGVFTATKGNITSPEYPELYPRNKRCIYEIVAPSRHCINLRFTHFSLESHSNCGYDSVQINSTTHRDTVHQYRRACGTTPPTNVTCEGKKLRLEFVSDDSKDYTGFVAEYDMVLAECANNNAGCKHVCKSNAQGKHKCACHAGYVLHPDDHDCKEGDLAARPGAPRQQPFGITDPRCKEPLKARNLPRPPKDEVTQQHQNQW